MAMRRWLRTSQAAALCELGKTAFELAIARGDLDGVLSKKVGSETRWCAEALWRWHLQGHAEGCWDLDEIKAFVERYPLPEAKESAA